MTQIPSRTPNLCVMNGDGIGQEVVPTAVTLLQHLLPNLQLTEAQAGWDCFLQTGASVPTSTLQTIRACGAGLFGAVSSPSHKVAGYRSAILTMRQELQLFANVRPIQSWPQLSPRPNIDMLIVRENTEGLYVGIERREGNKAIAERHISYEASLRIGQFTRNLMQRLGRRRVTIVHKANVLPVTDGLFRDAVREAFSGSQFEVDELLVDVAALKLVAQPEQFDVIVTTNLFGDILSDLAAHWGGGLGMAASLNWGDGVAVAEPVHGSAPDIAGQGLANPIATLLSAVMLLRFVWGLEEEAKRVETAVSQTLQTPLPTENVTQTILQRVLAHL